jgi:hypothetical protein
VASFDAGAGTQFESKHSASVMEKCGVANSNFVFLPARCDPVLSLPFIITMQLLLLPLGQ